MPFVRWTVPDSVTHFTHTSLCTLTWFLDISTTNQSCQFIPVAFSRAHPTFVSSTISSNSIHVSFRCNAYKYLQDESLCKATSTPIVTPIKLGNPISQRVVNSFWRWLHHPVEHIRLVIHLQFHQILSKSRSCATHSNYFTNTATFLLHQLPLYLISNLHNG